MAEQLPPTAAEAYERNYEEICRLMANVLTKILGEHERKDEKTWAHVGDQGRILEVLRELDEFLRPL